MAKTRSKSKAKPAAPNRVGGTGSAGGPQRLNKVLAAAGLGSRREVEELIVQGRVEVDQEVVTNLATKVDPARVKIKVDGQSIRLKRPVYYALNKPKGVLSTNFDPSGRARVVDFVPSNERVFSVGRLDQHSEGLILLTNDGTLAQRLAHPRYGVQKTYFVTVAGEITATDLAKLKKGVYLAEGIARIDGARIRSKKKTSTDLEIVLSEGKNREIRRLLAREGHKVLVLRRIAIGPLRLGDLPVGAARPLTKKEIAALYEAASGPKQPKARRDRPSASRPADAPTQRPSVQPEALDPASFPEEAWPDDGPATVGLEYIMDDALDLEELDYDDDFVTGPDHPPRTGSILDFDPQPASPPQEKSPRKTARGRASPGGSGRRPRKKSARGSRDAVSRRAKPSARRGAPSAGSKKRRR